MRLLKEFFHYSPVRIKKNTLKILIFSAVVCAEICIATFFVLIFNFYTAANNRIMLQMTAIICGVILSGMLFCFLVYERSHKKISRNSRYTYVDIQEKALVFSSYNGEYSVGGKKIIVRELYYIPFSGLKSVETDKSGRHLVLSGKIRYFSMDSDNLGYHIKDGDVIFDREWLNIGGSEQVTSVHIPYIFGNPDSLRKSVTEGYKRYLETPKPKPYVFREADFIRRRAKPRVLPENFGYKRNW